MAVTFCLRYFFDSNPESNGCGSSSDAGYEQMEWLRIQLRFIRQRGMKAILIGHVPPARTETKANWEESCWQKYTLWLRQYRDVVVGSLYGHMNIDHFMFQDSKDVDLIGLQEGDLHVKSQRTAMDRRFSVQSVADYLVDLRDSWSKLPDPSKVVSEKKSKKGEKNRDKRYLKKIGGKWAERYMVAHVAPSVVPNYFPSLRVIEYNITGLEDVALDARHGSNREAVLDEAKIYEESVDNCGAYRTSLFDRTASSFPWKWSHKKKKKAKRPRLVIPEPPSKSAPPGPAYSPQTFTWLGFTQYYANLTYLNNEPTNSLIMQESERGRYEHESGVSEGKPFGSSSQQILADRSPRTFSYEVEYSTFNDSIYKLRDMTVRSYLQLAQRIGKYRPTDEDRLSFFTLTDGGNAYPLDAGHVYDAISVDNGDDGNPNVMARKKHKKHKGHKRRKKHRGSNNKVWFTFLKRAFVGAKADEDIHDEYGFPTAAHSRQPVKALEVENEL